MPASRLTTALTVVPLALTTACGPPPGANGEIAIVISPASPAHGFDGMISVSGQFGASMSRPSVAERCTERVEGACRVVTCPPTPAGTGGGLGVSSGLPRALRAGELTVRGADGRAVELSSRPIGYVWTEQGLRWAVGERLAISMTDGPELPAFMLEITVPPVAVFSAPALGDTIDRAAPLSARWTPVDDGEIELRLTQPFSATQGSTDATCRFAASAGEGVVPLAVTAGLAPSDSEGTNARLLATLEVARTVMAGGVPVRALVRNGSTLGSLSLNVR